MTLITAFRQASVLNFTHEISENQQLNFLDVHVGGYQLIYKVYRKPTNTEVYLNSCSECPAQFKTDTIKCLINRYFKISSSREAFLSSISSLKQVFINNGYSNSEFHRILLDFCTIKITLTLQTLQLCRLCQPLCILLLKLLRLQQLLRL